MSASNDVGSDGSGLIKCGCGSLAQLRVTKKGDNLGREYWGCARNFGDRERCNFFKWSDNGNKKATSKPFSNNNNKSSASSSSFVNSNNNNNASSSNQFQPSSTFIGSSSSSSNDHHQHSNNNDIGAPMCPKHQTLCVQKKVNKEGPNKGRLFWCCDLAHSCYFEWCKEGTKVADYLLNPESQQRPLYSSTYSSKNTFGAHYPISLQLVGTNILQQAMKQQKNRHETLIFNDANYDCVLVTFPKLGFIMDKLLRALKELFEKDRKITKLNELEYLFPLDQHETLRKFFLDVKVDGASIQVQDFPEIVKLIINNYPQIDITKIDQLCTELDFAHKFPKQVWTKLRPFQKQGISFAVKRGGRVLLGDEMGVGKTLQGLSTMYFFKQDWPLLIICPSSLKHNWGKEIEEWFISDERGHSDITMDKIKIISHGKQIPDNYINIVSYTMAANMLEAKSKKNNNNGEYNDDNNDNNDDSEGGGAILNGIKFNCIICDESHYLKNQSTKRSAFLLPFLKQSKRLVMITGTPALSRPVEVYPQLNLLLDDKFTFTKNAFIHRYCDAKDTAFGIDDKGSSNVLELNYLLSRTVMIRRRKETVLSELPDKQRQRVLLSVKASDLKQLEFSQERMKRAIEKMKTAMSKEEHSQSNFDKNSEIFRMYTMTGKAKLPAVKEYIQDMIENTGDLKFLVFAYHKEVMDGIEECVASELASFYNIKLKKKKDSLQKQMRGDYYIRIDGSTDSNRRQNLVNTFENNPHCRVAILSIKAAGVGYNMTSCSTVLFAELYWTPSDLRQAEDRVHRMGQTRSVSIKYLLGKDTFDEYLWPLLEKKLDVVGKSVDGESHVDKNVDSITFDRINQLDDDDDDIDIEDIDMDDIENTEYSTPAGNYKRRYYDDDEDEEEYYEEEMKKKPSPKLSKSSKSERSPKPQSSNGNRGGSASSSNNNNENDNNNEIKKVIPPQNSNATDFLKGFLFTKNGKLPPSVILMRDENTTGSNNSITKKEYTYKKSFRDSSNTNNNNNNNTNTNNSNSKKRHLEDDDDENIKIDDDEEDIEFGTPKKKNINQPKTSPFFSKFKSNNTSSGSGSLLPNTSNFKQKLPSKSNNTNNNTIINNNNEDFNNEDLMQDDQVNSTTTTTTFLNLSNAFKRQSDVNNNNQTKFITPSKFVLPNKSSNSSITPPILPPKLLSSSSQIPSIPSPVGNNNTPSPNNSNLKTSPLSTTMNRSSPITPPSNNNITNNNLNNSIKTNSTNSNSNNNNMNEETKPTSDLEKVLSKFVFQGSASISPFARTPPSHLKNKSLSTTINTPSSSSHSNHNNIGNSSSTNHSTLTPNMGNGASSTSKFVPPIFKSPPNNNRSSPLVNNNTNNNITNNLTMKSTFVPPSSSSSLNITKKTIEPESKKLKIDESTTNTTTIIKQTNSSSHLDLDDDFILDDTILPDIL